MAEYRTSKYNIYVNLEKSDDVLIMQGYTGAYILVQKELARFLNDQHKYDINDTTIKCDDCEYILTPDLIRNLKKKGIITNLAEEAEEKFLKKIVNHIHEKYKNKSADYLFLLSYDCSFSCNYCFQKPMKKQLGKAGTRLQMTKELVDNIIKSIPVMEKINKIEKSGKAPAKVVFYGGEPFLQKNKELVEHIIFECNKTGEFRYYAISNGYELEHYSNLLGEEKISDIQITLHNSKENHKKNRYGANINTFYQICDNISMALEKGINIQLRLNVDKSNINTISSLIPEIEKRGWNTKNGFSCFIAPISLSHLDSNEEKIYNLSSLYDKIRMERKINKQLSIFKLYEEIYLEKMSFYFNEEKNLSNLFHSVFCSGQTNMLVFDPFGNIYSCLELGADPSRAVGRINADGSFSYNNTIKKYWESRIASSNDTCAQCAYALFCGGGCAIKAEERNGTIHSNYCNGFKEFFNKKVAEVFENKEKYIDQSKYQS